MEELLQYPQLTKGAFYPQLERQVPENRVVRALSWNQPYAALMLHGKQETRRRNTKVRGWVLICSCLKPYTEETVKGISGEHYTRIQSIKKSDIKPFYEFGKAIAIGHLHNSRPMNFNDEDICFVDCYPKLWVWEFRNVHAIEPFDWKGKQGWANVDIETQKKIIIL